MKLCYVVAFSLVLFSNMFAQQQLDIAIDPGDMTAKIDTLRGEHVQVGNGLLINSRTTILASFGYAIYTTTNNERLVVVLSKERQGPIQALVKGVCIGDTDTDDEGWLTACVRELTDDKKEQLNALVNEMVR